jgi:hypothetical protein
MVIDVGHSTRNMWLQQHYGYRSDTYQKDDEIGLNEVGLLELSRARWSYENSVRKSNNLPLATVQALLWAGHPVTAHVDRGRHFVLDDRLGCLQQ